VTDLWSNCAGEIRFEPLTGALLRMVESQQQVATLSLVDDLAEQALLEDLLEATKPPLPKTETGAGAKARTGTGAGLHYLLATPFRYPPLQHGSRFGRRHEPSLFYGSRRLPTLLAEVAYYRFVFWSGMREPPPSGLLRTQHSLFRAQLKAPRGARLQGPPCANHEAMLRHPSDYGPTQQLGSALRRAGVDAFEFVSARDQQRGINIALFHPGVLTSRQPRDLRRWFCETRAEQVSFSPEASSELYRYALQDFLIDGELPRPAA
jgi:hypothetical protein